MGSILFRRASIVSRFGFACRSARVRAVGLISQAHAIRRFATYAFPVSSDEELSRSSGHARRRAPVATCDSSRRVTLPRLGNLRSGRPCVSSTSPIRLPLPFTPSSLQWVSESTAFRPEHPPVCACAPVEKPSPSPCSRENSTTGIRMDAILLHHPCPCPPLRHTDDPREPCRGKEGRKGAEIAEIDEEEGKEGPGGFQTVK